VRAFIVALIAVAASNAVAKPRVQHKQRRYAVRAIRVGGNATDEDKAALVPAVGNAVEFVIVGNNGDDLVRDEAAANVEMDHPRLHGCLEPRCNLQFGDLLHAPRVMWIDITRSGPPGAKADWKVAVSQFSAETVRDLGVAELPCHDCTRDELVGKFNVFLDPLFSNEPPPLPLCTLKVASQPPGATVMFDSVVVGETPFAHSVAAGTHKVGVEQSDFAPGAADVECAPQATEKLVFALGPKGSQVVQAAPSEERPRRSLALKLVGGGLLALGAAGIISGALDLSLDGKGTCSLSAGHTQCKQLYSTGTQGAALVGAGVAAAVGGLVMLVVDAVRARPRKLSANVQIGPSAVALGVLGRF
jgi:hypothetical protein